MSSKTTVSLQQKINSAEDLHGVVRTMKAVAASSVGQYENAVESLDDYYRTVQLGLAACFRDPTMRDAPPPLEHSDEGAVIGIAFGSDQGLVGQFNEVMADFVEREMHKITAPKSVWVVGERVGGRLQDSGLEFGLYFQLPSSIKAISPLIASILTELENRRERDALKAIYLFHNHPTGPATYAPTSQRLLPLDDAWRRELTALPWPTKRPPEVLGGPQKTLPALLREYLFVSLFRGA